MIFVKILTNMLWVTINFIRIYGVRWVKRVLFWVTGNRAVMLLKKYNVFEPLPKYPHSVRFAAQSLPGPVTLRQLFFVGGGGSTYLDFGVRLSFNASPTI